MTDLLSPPLHEAHAALDAVWGEWDGWSLPRHYGDPGAEYEAARRDVVRTDRSHRTKLRVEGADRVKFLQNILTNDLKRLAPGRGAYAAFLHSTGKLIADFRVSVLAEAVLLDAEAGSREEAFPNLDKYNLGYDCEIADVSDDYGVVTLAGPKALETLSGVLPEAPPPDEPYRSVETEWAGRRIVAVTAEGFGVPAVDLFVPAAAAPSLWEAFAGVRPAGFAALETLRLEAGTPRFGPDMDGTVNPMEADLQSALSFDKGCYIGQEVVAKIDSLGHVNRKLTGFRIKGNTPPAAGASLLDEGKKAGHVTSAAFSPALGGVVALGYVHRKSAVPGRVLEVEVEGRPAEAEVAERPFVRAG